MTPLPIVPGLAGLADTPVGIELPRLAAGEPWFTTQIAGLQYYDYARRDEDLDVLIMPANGDRLQLVRIPRTLTTATPSGSSGATTAISGTSRARSPATSRPLLDSGAPARAYVVDAGDGEAWSCRALVVGQAATPWHERHLRHVVHEALYAVPEREARFHRRTLKRAERSADRSTTMRTRRLRQAVETLMAVPFEPELPAVGSHCDPDTLARALGCSRSTVVRLAAGAGITIGRYCTWLGITPELDAALRDWCRAPRSKADISQAWGVRHHRQEPPYEWIRA